MRVLLTGATGFLGAHVLRVLLRERVPTYALIRPGANRWRLEGVAPEGWVEGDLAAPEGWRGQLSEIRPEVVIHCAWIGVGNRHRDDPGQVEQNLLPALELFRLCAAAGCQSFVGVGSQAEYGPVNCRASEAVPTRPTTLYGATKLALATLLEVCCAQANVRFAWLRLFSTYGPFEDEHWLIPYLTRALLRGERPALTAGGQRWDYLFGPDAAEAVWRVARDSGARGIFNLGSGQSHALRHIVEVLRDMINPELPIGWGEVPYRPDQVMHLEADITRLQQATGWHPRTTLEEGLRQTLEWHRQQRPVEPRGVGL